MIDKEIDDYEEKLNRLLDRMERARTKGKGCNLSNEDLQLLNTTILGQALSGA